MVSSKTGTLIQVSLAPKNEILTLGYDTVSEYLNMPGSERERSGDLRPLDSGAGLTQEKGGDGDLET